MSNTEIGILITLILCLVVYFIYLGYLVKKSQDKTGKDIDINSPEFWDDFLGM